MKITKLYIESFGGLSDKTIELSDINVIIGGNESGKTTVAAFLLAMLFGMERDRNKEGGTYESYLPWEDKERYGGYIEFEEKGNCYRLSRSFLARKAKISLFDMDGGREIYEAEKFLSEILPENAEEEYVNTFFVSGPAGTPDEALSARLKNHVLAESGGKNEKVDAARALRLLEQRRSEFAENDPGKKINKLNILIDEAERTEKKLDDIAGEEIAGREEIKELEAELAKENIPTLFEEKESDYYIYKERFSLYQKQLEDSAELSAQLEETIVQSSRLEQNADRLKECKEALRKLRKYQKESDAELYSFQSEVENTNRIMYSEGKSNIYRTTGVLAAAAVFFVIGILLLIFKSHAVLIVISLLLMLLSVAFFFYFSLKNRKEMRVHKDHIKEIRAEIIEREKKTAEYLRMNPSEEELTAEYENCLKEDGRRPEILAKEEDISEKLSRMETEIEEKRADLLEFFSAFGKMENLKEDELLLQEEKLRREKEEKNKKRAELGEKIARLKEKVLRYRMQIEAGEENADKLLSYVEKRKQLEEERSRNLREIEAIDLAYGVIEEIAAADHKSFGKELNEKASRYAAAFTGRKYTSFVSDEKLNIKVDRLDRYVPADKLSGGSVSQLRLALRLAMGDFLLSENLLPLVFDDSFALFDDERLAATLSGLGESGKQLIILSSVSREETILGQLGLNYTVIEL